MDDCKHEWETVRLGGNPAEESATETTVVCKHCGLDRPHDLEEYKDFLQRERTAPGQEEAERQYTQA